MSNLLSSIMVALISSWVTVYLSLGRYKTERWWELKVETYKKIIECLHHQKFCAEKVYKKDVEGIPYSSEYITQLSEKSSISHLELSKMANIGSFIISDKAHSIIINYLDALKHEDNYIDELETTIKESKIALENMILIAKNDLSSSRIDIFSYIRKKLNN